VQTGALIALAVLILYAPVTLLDRTLVPSTFAEFGLAEPSRRPAPNLQLDWASSAYYEFPANDLVGQAYRSGELPLWNPYQAGGVPLAAQYSTRAFFPYQILEDMSPPALWDGFLLARVWIAGFLAFLLFRSWGLRRGSATTGALLFAFSGSMSWFISLEQFANVAMLLPGVLWALDRMIVTPTASRTGLAALFVGLLLLAGQPEMVLFAAAIAVVTMTWRLSDIHKRRPLAPADLVRLGASAGVVAGLGLLLAATQLVPFLDLVDSGFHAHTTASQPGRGAETPSDFLVAIMLPGFFSGDTFERVLPTPGVWDFLGGAVGTGGLFLAIVGATRSGPHRGLAVALGAYAVVVLSKNVGAEPFVWIGNMPLFEQVWSPRWAGASWSLALVGAAAIGVDRLGEIRSDRERWLPPAGALAAIILLLAAQPSPPFRDLSDTSLWAGRVGNVLVAAAMIAMLAWLDGRRNLPHRTVAVGLIAILDLAIFLPRGYEGATLAALLVLAGATLLIAWFATRQPKRGLAVAAIVWVAVLIPADLTGGAGLPRRTDPFPTSATSEFLAARSDEGRAFGLEGALFPNLGSTVGVSDPRFINTLSIDTQQHFTETHLLAGVDRPSDAVLQLWYTGLLTGQGNDPPLDPADVIVRNRAAYQLLSVRYYAASDSAEGPDLPFSVAAEFDGKRILEDEAALPRAYIASTLLAADSAAEAQRLAVTGGATPDVAVVESPKLVERVAAIPDPVRGVARITQQSLNSVTVAADTPTGGLLVLTDTFAPDWTALVDGTIAPIVRVNGIVRGVWLEAGTHTIRFRYWPDGLTVALIGTLVANLAILLLLIGAPGRVHTRLRGKRGGIAAGCEE
jgi:hypothetical protein